MASRFMRTVSSSAPRTWTEIQPSQFCSRDLSGLKKRLNDTGDQPLCVRATFPTVTDGGTGIEHVAKALCGHASHLRALHIRAITPDFIGTFLKHALLTGPRKVPALEELHISVHDDSSSLFEHKDRWPGTILHDAADVFPSLRTLVLPAYHECIPIPSTLTHFKNLTTLRLNGMGLSVGSPLYPLFQFLLRTPNLESFFYKTTDQFSYQISRCPGLWAPTDKYLPVSLPVPLPHLRVADVSASGSGSDSLRNILALNLQAVHLDGSRIRDGLEDWTEGLMELVRETIEELSQRSPNIQHLTLTEMPQQDRVFKWLLCGEELDGWIVKNAKGDVPFRRLEELIIRDAQLSDDQIANLPDEPLDSASIKRDVELTDDVLYHYAASAGGVLLRKLGIHRTRYLSGKAIVAAGRKGVQTLAENGISETFRMEFMENEGPGQECVRELERLGVQVEWTNQVSGPDTEREGWWTPDFRIEDTIVI